MLNITSPSAKKKKPHKNNYTKIYILMHDEHNSLTYRHEINLNGLSCRYNELIKMIILTSNTLIPPNFPLD